MSREVMSEEERRRRRNEASRRCYLKRKAFHAAQKKLAAKAEAVAKGRAKPPKAKPVEAKPAKARPPAPRGKDPVSAAEKIVRRFAKIAAGIKPMVKETAEFLGAVYRAEDQRVVEKVERVLSKGLGVEVASPAGDDRAKSRVLVQAVSKAVKTPAFRLATEPAPEPEAQPDAGAPFVPFPSPDWKEEDDEQPAEVPVDPALIEKVEAGEADKSDIAAPLPVADDKDEDDEDEDDEDDDLIDALDEEDEEDEDDDSDEARARRAERRARDEADNEAEYQAGRWEMLGEMGAQGAFDD